MTGYERLIESCNENLKFYPVLLGTLKTQVDSLKGVKSKLSKSNPSRSLSDLDEMVQFNNYGGYVTIALLDLSVNLKNLILAKTDWERIYFIKNSYLIIHETLNKLKPSNGQSFIEQTIKNNYPTLRSHLNELFEEIDYFKLRVNYKKIEETRHNTAGHIEKKLEKYYDTIMELDGEEAGEYIIEFLKILQRVANLVKNYSELAGKRLLAYLG